MDDVIVYSTGLVHASVCTALPADETVKRVNATHPTGVSSEWAISEDDAFASGEPNPCPCDKYPETRKHYLLVC